MPFAILADRQYGVDALVGFQWQEVDNRFTARAATGLWNLVNLEPVELAATREAQDRVVRIGHEQSYNFV